MLYGGNIKQLKELLEGKTISQIEASRASEGLCKFILSDGTSFDLCGNDLGFWVEDEDSENEY